eukprot:CAMPEP_0118690010 /NCGR_PEP_ID=MMETSP0800-20121206/9826_1 /TAXON_ID=210618 ORGANISM="Striatella unipunctata, Strain CCMP2910" /NCGR_SAMPLE_ID=MMETSP0800 /ASSEMBLY_ACC=CAM_ASM_000638 /LENGTH=552 /DNA_ID=CAMNT_0006587509 /DNA_START=405 /DNA_END=2063 /DNA_ORIENTATION=+
MNNWLIRGFGNNSSSSNNNRAAFRAEDQDQEHSEPSSPSAQQNRNTQAYENPTTPSPPMTNYPPGGIAAELAMEHPHEGRSKAHQYGPAQYPAPNGANGTQASSSARAYDVTRQPRSVRPRSTPNGDDDTHTRNRSRSNRPSNSLHSQQSTTNRSRPGHLPPHGQPPPHGGGPFYPPAQQTSHLAGVTSAAPPQHYHPPLYGRHPNQAPVVSANPTPENYGPPPAISTQPQQESQTMQRRPAYLLHRDLVIGKGSYGQVCIASRGEAEGHTTSGRSGKRKKFACKCVVLRNDPKYIAKLQEEVNVLRELRGHDNVIKLYDVFCVDNELFIITELGRGGDLFHLLTTHPKHGVTEAYAAKTVAEMLSAVAFLHSRNICHRDLKLENWVLESGKDVWSSLKLIDFGLSTHFTPGHKLSRVVGSSYYVAPEVLKKAYTEACDLWSLGVIVYMLLSGAPPFYGKNDEAIKASIVQGEYSFPQELFRDVSDDAMGFVSTLLSYNTEYRYTAEQALSNPWLEANLDPVALQTAKDGARGVGRACVGMHEVNRPEPMQM